MEENKRWNRPYISTKEDIEIAKECTDPKLLFYLFTYIVERLESSKYDEKNQEEKKLIVEVARIFGNFLPKESYGLIEELIEELEPEKDYRHRMVDILVEIGKDGVEALIAYGFAEMKWGWYVDEYIISRLDSIEDERIIEKMLKTLRVWSDYNDTDEWALRACLFYLDKYKTREIVEKMSEDYEKYHPMVKNMIKSLCERNFIEILVDKTQEE